MYPELLFLQQVTFLPSTTTLIILVREVKEVTKKKNALSTAWKEEELEGEEGGKKQMRL